MSSKTRNEEKRERGRSRRLSREQGATLKRASRRKKPALAKKGAERFVLQETKMGPSSLSTLLPSRVARGARPYEPPDAADLRKMSVRDHYAITSSRTWRRPPRGS